MRTFAFRVVTHFGPVPVVPYILPGAFQFSEVGRHLTKDPKDVLGDEVKLFFVPEGTRELFGRFGVRVAIADLAPVLEVGDRVLYVKFKDDEVEVVIYEVVPKS